MGGFSSRFVLKFNGKVKISVRLGMLMKFFIFLKTLQSKITVNPTKQSVVVFRLSLAAILLVATPYGDHKTDCEKSNEYTLSSTYFPDSGRMADPLEQFVVAPSLSTSFGHINLISNLSLTLMLNLTIVLFLLFAAIDRFFSLQHFNFVFSGLIFKMNA